MDRRTFLSTATYAAIASGLHPLPSLADPEKPKVKPMALGLLISPYGTPEATIKRVRDMGFSNCFLSLDGYIAKFTLDAAEQTVDCWRSTIWWQRRLKSWAQSHSSGTLFKALPLSAWCRRQPALRGSTA